MAETGFEVVFFVEVGEEFVVGEVFRLFWWVGLMRKKEKGYKRERRKRKPTSSPLFFFSVSIIFLNSLRNISLGSTLSPAVEEGES